MDRLLYSPQSKDGMMSGWAVVCQEPKSSCSPEGVPRVLPSVPRMGCELAW